MSARERAAQFLRVFLADGPRPATEVLRAAEARGLSEKILRRAKRQLDVEAERDGFGPGSSWYWRLLDGSATGDVASPLSDSGALEADGAHIAPEPSAAEEERPAALAAIPGHADRERTEPPSRDLASLVRRSFPLVVQALDAEAEEGR